MQSRPERSTRAMGIPATSITNVSIIRPVGFYVIGFLHLKYADLYVIFLGFVYVVTVLCNSFIVSIIWFSHHLHTPKYIAVANLGVVDLVLSSTFIPSAINTMITKDTFMSYNACVGQNFFNYSFQGLESCSLVVLAYDRLIAICFPLRHNSINTPMRMISILVFVWTFIVSSVVLIVLILAKLSFCDSLTVYDYFCNYAALIRLSCNNATLPWTAGLFLSFLFFVMPVSLIVISYACIFAAVFRMKSVASRYKALATCTEHLVLVAIFFVPIIALNLIDQLIFLVGSDAKMLSMSLCSSIPSCLNPLVYSLATRDIRKRLLTMPQKVKVTFWTGQA